MRNADRVHARWLILHTNNWANGLGFLAFVAPPGASAQQQLHHEPESPEETKGWDTPKKTRKS